MASLPSISLGLGAVGAAGQERVSDEAQWLARAQAGDGGALAQIYRRYVDEIFGYAFNQLGQRQEAEDITSEVFLRLVRSLQGFRGEASLRTWLFSICRNVIRDHWRQHAARPAELPLEDLAQGAAATASGCDADTDSDPDAPPPPVCGELGRWVLTQLNERERTVLKLRFLESQSVAQVAASLGLSPGNVKVIQHRALRRATALAQAATEATGRAQSPPHPQGFPS